MLNIAVMFRIDKFGANKQVTAVFPYEESTVGKPWERMCYAHIGQHGTCDWGWVLSKTRPATLVEYRDLQQELEGIGYNLRIIKKRGNRK